MESLDKVTEVVFYQLSLLVIFISIFISALNFPKNKFVKGILICACLFTFFPRVIWLSHVFDIESIRNLFYWNSEEKRTGDYNFILNFLFLTSYFLFLWGISLFLGKDYEKREIPMEKHPMKGNPTHLGVLLLLFVITFGIYTLFWLYKTVNILRKNFILETPYTPGKAVGFFFIPLVNLYWVFYFTFSFPLVLKRVESKYFGSNVGFHFHPTLISITILIASLIIYMPHSNIQVEIAKYLFGFSLLLIPYLTIQAKMNAFLDLSKQLAEEKPEV